MRNVHSQEQQLPFLLLQLEQWRQWQQMLLCKSSFSYGNYSKSPLWSKDSRANKNTVWCLSSNPVPQCDTSVSSLNNIPVIIFLSTNLWNSPGGLLWLQEFNQLIVEEEGCNSCTVQLRFTDAVAVLLLCTGVDSRTKKNLSQNICLKTFSCCGWSELSLPSILVMLSNRYCHLFL